MALLIAGLVLFFGIHLVPAIPALRARWVGVWGEERYRRTFAVVAAVGLLLIVAGYIIAPRGAQLFTGSSAAKSIAPFAMVLSFVLLASANMKTHVRARIRHPMLLGIIIWSTVHLLANGDARGTVLFGSFLAFSVVDLASAVSRGAVKPFVPAHKYDVMAVVGGIVAAFVVMLLHRVFFGVPAVWWSL
ncbi:MAG: NnrU family protein [Rhodospirillaceae bacterium]